MRNIAQLKLFFLLAICSMAQVSFATMTAHDRIWLLMALEKGIYDVFEYTVDSTVIIGAHQHSMHFGKVDKVYQGNVEAHVEVLCPVDEYNSRKKIKAGTKFLIIAQKQKYRYKIGGAASVTCIFHYRFDGKYEKASYNAIKQYFHYKQNKLTGLANFKRENSSRTTGYFKDGIPDGVWLYQNDYNRYYVQYKNGSAQDTTYEYVISENGWQLVVKQIKTNETDVYWSYKPANPRSKRGPFLLHSYSIRYDGSPTKSTRFLYFPDGQLHSKITTIDYQNYKQHNDDIRYYDGPVSFYYSNRKDSIRGQYQYGYKAGDWQYYDTDGNVDSMVNYECPSSKDTIYFQSKTNRYEDKSGKFILKNGHLHGEVTIYSHGVLDSRTKYIEGLRQGLSLYYNDSLLYASANYKNGKLHGKKIIYDSQGNIVSVEEYDKGLLHGTKNRLSDGQVIFEETYENGHLKSLKKWNDSGTLITNLSYNRGLPTGKNALKNGGYATLLNGVYEGPAELYGSNKMKTGYGNFHNGKKAGVWQEKYFGEHQFKEVNYTN